MNIEVKESNEGWDRVEAILGWISFVLWVISFYPQLIENYKLKSVAGFSIEYAILNPMGYFMYSIYNI